MPAPPEGLPPTEKSGKRTRAGEQSWPAQDLDSSKTARKRTRNLLKVRGYAEAVFLEALDGFQMFLSFPDTRLFIISVFPEVLGDTLFDALSLESFQSSLDVFILS